jgi:hypothetical protein
MISVEKWLVGRANCICIKKELARLLVAENRLRV